MRSSAQTSGASAPRRPESTDRYAPRQSTAPLRTGRSRQRNRTFPAKRPDIPGREARRSWQRDRPQRAKERQAPPAANRTRTHPRSPPTASLISVPTSALSLTSARHTYRPRRTRHPRYPRHPPQPLTDLRPPTAPRPIRQLPDTRPHTSTKKTIHLSNPDPDHPPPRTKHPENNAPHRPPATRRANTGEQAQKTDIGFARQKQTPEPLERDSDVCFSASREVPRQRATEKRMRHWDGIASGRRLRLRSDGTSNAVPRRELPGKAIPDTRISDSQRPGTRNANRPTPKSAHPDGSAQALHAQPCHPAEAKPPRLRDRPPGCGRNIRR